jgi:hypothetical protein
MFLGQSNASFLQNVKEISSAEEWKKAEELVQKGKQSDANFFTTFRRMQFVGQKIVVTTRHGKTLLSYL